MRSIRSRLIVTYLLLIVLPLGLLGWFMLQTLDRFYVDRLQDDMSIEAGLIASVVAKDVPDQLGEEALALLNNPPTLLRSQARIFVFDVHRRLIAASDSAFASVLGQSIAEPGLDAALAGQSTRGIESSPATGLPIAYVAQPILNGNRIVGAIHLAYSLAQIQDAQRDLQIILVGVVVAMALVVSLFGLQLARSITRPLTRLERAAAEIARGDLAQRVPADAPAELAALAQRFNQMAEALHEAERTRQASFANIAHDVRTPLGSIQAATEALAAGAVDQPELRQRLLDGLTTQTHYLSRLTNDLLRLAAYEGGGLVLRCSAVSLPRLIDKAVCAFQARAEARSVALVLDVPTSLPAVWVDPDRVLEALFNLLDNALAYTPDGGEICLRAASDDAGRVAWVHVCDSGPGVPDDTRPLLFRRYWRGDYRRTASGANMGLGLSIVREIVKAHDGTIDVANLPHGGADFHFSLPLSNGLSQS